MNTRSVALALLLIFLGLIPGMAAPVQHRDISLESPWAAHLDVTRLSDPALEGFLLQVAGFDRVLQLQTVLKEELAIDWKSVDGVTLFGAGGQSRETAVILRGDLGGVEQARLPIVKNVPSYRGIPLRQGPVWGTNSLILARHSNQEWVAGTSLEAVKNSLDLLAGRKDSRKSGTLTKHAASELQRSAAMFALDMEKLDGELKFEADLTRAIQRGWFLIGTRDDLVEATLMIESTDTEGLLFLQKQLQMLTVFLKSREESPAVWLELLAALEVDTRGHWMTVKVAATPEKAAVFLKSLGPLFMKSPEEPDSGN
ncbi:hypothetical protein V2O64_02035 [Verrucomicrobiaceae bacterium 227]